jgi:predicted helicase
MTTANYIDNINKRYKQGNATEHTFRGDLQQLIEALVPNIQATNEPKRQSCGAPDYILTKKDIPVGFIEAKDIGDKDLDGLRKGGNKEQFDRYKSSLSNLIFTDYIDFHLYRDAQLVTTVSIAKLTDNGIVPLPENFGVFENLIKDFATHVGQNIKSSKQLAEMMAGKARLLSDVIENALLSDEERHENSTLKDQMNAFAQILIHDINPQAFADVYAQTIAYGLFAARLHDPTLPTFSRQEAAELIPRSNPFLRKLFSYIAGPDIDDRIKWIVDNLVEIFLHCNVEKILQNYGKATKMEDPIIHFYETFLSEYDPKLRKARGVWYTPAPVVNFIVRAVDDILKTEFGLAQGLADTSKTKIKVNLQETDKRYKDNIKTVEEEVHRVQILDPATGTGTFLAEVIKQIHSKFQGQQGIWSNYVEQHLLPRINGFELLMASYAMAHLQLDMLLKDTGFKPQPTSNQRLRVYLTNSLEESHPDTGTLFANWLSAEANEANRIKRDTPVMCVIGNPPYSVSSTNKGKWIQNLIADYKKNLNERKINLDDDYIKFIRYGQHFIDKNGSGILAYISNNSFIDGITHRQMRKSLLESFDKIYILDLHGSAKKKETAPDGTKDENVFDIQQGVSINIFIKNGKKEKNSFGITFHSELFGKRELKYAYLSKCAINKINWKQLDFSTDNNFFVPRNSTDENSYSQFINLIDLIPHYNSGIQTKRDNFCIRFSKVDLENIELDAKTLDVQSFKTKYKLPEDGRDWKVEWAIKDVLINKPKIIDYFYRPFDIRKTLYTGNSKGFMGYPRHKTMSNVIEKNNLLLNLCRQQSSFDFQHIFISKNITDLNSISLQTKEQTYAFPLFLYPDTTGQQKIGAISKRTPNLDMEIVKKIGKAIKSKFEPDLDLRIYEPPAEGWDHTIEFGPVDILDYIYAVLHSPAYREKYKEFLKIDFPRVPYPKDKDTFWKLSELGGEIRRLHLMESVDTDKYITQYPEDGDNLVGKPVYKDGRVYINDTQYFDGVPQVAWEFYIGGYQPAQKWLKDRKDRKLEYDDILHYQRIIVALTETDRLMKEIDQIDFM